MAEGHVEAFPSVRDGLGNLEGERPVSGETAGVSDGTRSWVIPVALADALGVHEQAQESATVAAGVEHPPVR